ncbi:MAG: OmpA family protein [Parvibaculum sp.]|uniref:OmpA family protein n=1 Tax=Parvibaculum sp. TaxID=2024848 RepID=UPI0034A0991E
MIFLDRIGAAAIAILLAGILTAAAAEAPLSSPEAALLRIDFTPNESALSPSAHENIAAFATILRRQSSRLLIKAYAGPPRDASSTARKLSLRRALSVRHKLIDEGIGAGRIHVRALGGVPDSGPQDRVDIVLAGG